MFRMLVLIGLVVGAVFAARRAGWRTKGDVRAAASAGVDRARDVATDVGSAFFSDATDVASR